MVWQEHPQEESAGSCRAFACKYHGWRYGLDGVVNHITNEAEFFDLDKSKLRMPPVHCEVWAGFIFINLSEDPVPLRSFLGEILLPMETYPFHLMTQRYGFSTRIKGNWKLAVDSVCEWYHPPYVHGRFIDPDVAKAEKMVPPVDAYHYELFRPHMLTSVPGPPPLPPRAPGTAGPARQDQRWVYKLFRAGLFGPDDVPDIGPPAVFLNRGEIASWGNDQYWLFPNISIQIWARGYYITYTYWPETVDSHIYEIDTYFVPPANATERLAQELVVDSTIEFAMQDVNTIEATHSGPDNSGADHLPSQRSGVAHPAVPHGDPRHRGRLPVRRGEAVTMGNTLPQAFSEIEPYVADWALATRAERYAARLDRPFDELVAFYDAIAPRAEEAIAYLDGLDINALTDEATRLLHLLYSMILVSYAVNVFKQNRIPDAGAAFFEMVAEPIP